MPHPNSAPAAPAPAQFGNIHGYAFDGDQVDVHAEVRVSNPAAAATLRWVLQVWSSDTLIAEAECGPLDPDPFGIARIEARSPARLPAGTGEHILTLVLACDDGSGLRACDAASYPRGERFVLPRLEGAVSYSLHPGWTEITAGGISNPRPATNLSGSLVLELWALPAPYRGGAFGGILIGSEFVGALAGQSLWTNVATRLPACVLPEGSWHFVLMLREWFGDAYLTRDYRNFALPVTGPLPVTPADSAEPVAGCASVNRATIGELRWVRGISREIAAGIVAGRPWKRLDDLLAVRGIGPRLLARIKPRLRL